MEQREQPPRHPVVSYRRRRGRMSDSRRMAIAEHGRRFGLDLAAQTGVLDFDAVFGRQAPVTLEIGFGMGETTVAMAAADPDRDVLAVDVHTPGVGALVRDAAVAGLTNLRVMEIDALVLLRDRIAPGSLAEIRVYFPDPWPKARHHKRRLVTPEFVHLAATRLELQGRLHLATDWAEYGAQMLGVVAAEPLLVNPHQGPAPRPAWRPTTRFEAQGIAKGHAVIDVIAHRIGV